MPQRNRSSFGTIEVRRRDKNGKPIRWRAKYRIHGLTSFQTSPTFQRLGAAQAWLDHEEELIRLGHWTPWKQRQDEMRAEEKRGQILITDFIQEWIASNPGLTETTRAHYESVFKNRHEASLAGVTLTDLSPERCKQWWREIRNEFPTTKKRNKAALDLLKSTLTEGIERGLLPSNPAAQIHIEKADRPITKEKAIPTLGELSKLAENMPDRYEAAIWLLGACGLRMGELLELRRKDFIFDGASHLWTIHIDRQVQRVKGSTEVVLPKGGKTRTTVAPPSLNSLIKRQLETYALPGDEGIVFPNSKGTQTQPQRLRRHFAAARDSANLSPGITPHSLRHLAGTLYAQTGATQREIMDRLGHSTSEAAAIYQHVAADRPMTLLNALDSAFERALKSDGEIEYFI